MSFLAEVLSSARKMDIDTILEKAPKANDSVTSFRGEVQKYLENVYVNFTERHRQSKRLAEKASELKEELLSLNSTIEGITKENIAEAAANLAELKKEINESRIAVSMIDKMIRVHNDLLSLAKLRKSGKLVEGMQVVIELRDMVHVLLEEENTEALHEMYLRVKLEDTLIFQTAVDLFKEGINLTYKDDVFIMDVSKDESVEESICALFIYCESVIPLNEVVEFVRKLFEHIVVRIATVEIDCSESARLTVKLKSDSGKPDYKMVFSNLKRIAEFLAENFAYSLREDLSTLDYIGTALRSDLENLILKKCLQSTVPNNKEGLENYKTIASSTLILQNKLKEAKMLDDNSTALSDFVGHIDEHFVSKICEDLLRTSLTLMKKDLHDMIVIETESNQNSTNSFPQCGVSKSCIELIKNLEDTLQHSLSMEEATRNRVISTIKHILIQYQLVVPEHHQKLLQTIPQQVALFHNNCMYISHTVATWMGKLHKENATSTISLSVFEDQYKIKVTGTTYLNKCIQEQIDQIDKIIEDSGLTTLHLKDEFPQTAEKSIRQCLRQQELLKTVWHKVLPQAAYNETIGRILDHFCKSLMKPIMALEDISSTASTNLVDVFNVITTRAPKLLNDPREVHLHVESWNKFNELIFVLNASLVDINDRWADRKGPLAAAFKAEELRNLIKALFQNTDRRAHVLGKIF